MNKDIGKRSKDRKNEELIAKRRSLKINIQDQKNLKYLKHLKEQNTILNVGILTMRIIKENIK